MLILLVAVCATFQSLRRPIRCQCIIIIRDPRKGNQVEPLRPFRLLQVEKALKRYKSLRYPGKKTKKYKSAETQAYGPSTSRFKSRFLEIATHLVCNSEHGGHGTRKLEGGKFSGNNDGNKNQSIILKKCQYTHGPKILIKNLSCL